MQVAQMIRPGALRTCLNQAPTANNSQKTPRVPLIFEERQGDVAPRFDTPAPRASFWNEPRMMDHASDILPTPRISSVVLDYGADAEACTDDAVAISERGMRLRSHWCFDIGTQLSMAMVPPATRVGTSGRVVIEAIVVWCEPLGERSYESTLLFLELSDEQKQFLREFSFPETDDL